MAKTKRKTKPAATTDAVGHFAHTQDADSQIGLDGDMRGPIKLTMMGAGSGFTPRLVSDVVQIKGHDRGEICLVDIDRKRLTLVHKFIELLLAKLGKTGWTVTSSTRRREVMKDSDYIVNCIEVSGPECVRLDNDIPLEYGVGQCIGDTIGPGGCSRACVRFPSFLRC
jgi:alpha-galactosidase